MAMLEREGAGSMEVAGARRLIITDMVLDNFKSYAGEQHVGPFHKVRVKGGHQASA